VLLFSLSTEVSEVSSRRAEMSGEGVEEPAGASCPADVLQLQPSGEPEPDRNAAGVSGDALVSTVR